MINKPEKEIEYYLKKINEKMRESCADQEKEIFIRDEFQNLSETTKKEIMKACYWGGALSAFGAEKNKGNGLAPLRFDCLISDDGVQNPFNYYLEKYLNERKNRDSIYFLTDVANFGSSERVIFRRALFNEYGNYKLTPTDLRFDVLESYGDSNLDKKDFVNSVSGFERELYNLIKISKALGGFMLGGLSIKDHGFNEISTLLGTVEQSVIDGYCKKVKGVYNRRSLQLKEENGFMRFCFSLRWQNDEDNIEKILKSFVSKKNIPDCWSEPTVFFNIWDDVFRNNCYSIHDEQLLQKNLTLMQKLLPEIIDFDELEDRYISWGFEDKGMSSINKSGAGLSVNELSDFLEEGSQRLIIKCHALALSFGAALRSVGIKPSANLALSNTWFGDDVFAKKMAENLLGTFKNWDEKLFEGGVKLVSRKYLDVLSDVLNENNEKWCAQVNLTDDGMKISMDVSSIKDIALIKNLVILLLNLDISKDEQKKSKNLLQNLIEERDMKAEVENEMQKGGYSVSPMRIRKF